MLVSMFKKRGTSQSVNLICFHHAYEICKDKERSTPNKNPGCDLFLLFVEPCI